VVFDSTLVRAERQETLSHGNVEERSSEMGSVREWPVCYQRIFCKLYPLTVLKIYKEYEDWDTCTNCNQRRTVGDVDE